MDVLLNDDRGCLTVQRVRPWQRLVARYRSATLDRQLAEGAPPEADAYLAARAQQLTSAAYRHGLATGLRGLLNPGRPGGVAPSWPNVAAHRPQVPVRRARIGRSADELAGLADRLAAPEPVPAQGVAMVSCLLTDGGGPLYHESCHEDLGVLVGQAVEALDR